MRKLNNTTDAFLKIVGAGLWEKEIRLPSFDSIDFKTIYELSEEQSVVGLVAAGIERLQGIKAPQIGALQIVREALQYEQRNLSMNEFVAKLIDRLRKTNIYIILVKGQGVAQCYEKPLWRCGGDVDLLLSEENYEKAKSYLIPLATLVEREDKKKKHLGLYFDAWVVELHGAMPFGLSSRVDKVVNEVLHDVFYDWNVRSWMNGKTQVFLPAPNSDVILIFTHFLHHFFIEGVGLRQVCDWCRLLWTYKDSIDKDLLEKRIKKAGLMSEWRSFASLAVNSLDMPVDAMPFYDSKYKNKGNRVLKRILKCGNFGHNNDLSYRSRYRGLSYKIVAAWRRFVDFASLIPVFPVDAPRFFFTYMINKAK